MPSRLRRRSGTLARVAVPAGGPEGESPVLVDQFDGEAVEFRLGHHLERLAAEALRRPLPPFAEFPLVECVVEAEHGDAVADRAELLDRLSAHPLGRRLGDDEFGVLFLEFLEAPHQPVILGVGDFRLVEDVVAVVVVFDLSSEFFDFCHDLLWCFSHGHPS